MPSAVAFGGRRAMSRRVVLGVLALGLVPAGAMAYTANLGGQILPREEIYGPRPPCGV